MNASPATPAVKFLFDTKLDGPAAPPPVPRAEVDAIEAAHAAELQRVRTEAEKQGRDAGRKEALAGIEAQLSQKLDQLALAHATLQQHIDQRLATLQTLSLKLALTAAERLAGGLIEREPAQQVEHFFRTALALLPPQPRLQLLVAPQTAEVIGPRFAAILARNGRSNPLDILADETLAAGDCRIVWPDGGIEQNQERIGAEIERIFAAFLEASGTANTEEGKPA